MTVNWCIRSLWSSAHIPKPKAIKSAAAIWPHILGDSPFLKFVSYRYTHTVAWQRPHFMVTDAALSHICLLCSPLHTPFQVNLKQCA